MKTTTTRFGLFSNNTNGSHNNAGDTIRKCENGKTLYVIWSDGTVWFYVEDGSLPLELDRTGTMRKWDGKQKSWVEMEAT